ncbi:MAG: class I fructose-bisphosphate aldolase [bacterium]|nr:class I fructose-bisphosphate aldolase [bacterium]
MKNNMLNEVAAELVAKGKGILAADESGRTADKRFEAVGIPKTEEMRRKWRELLFTTPGIEEALSGVILFDETIRQSSGGITFPNLLAAKGIMPGIKVDKGTVDLTGSVGEKITEGLDGLEERLAEYSKMGAKFAKWRAVITIGENLPSKQCLQTNADILSQYAIFCQEAGIVPMVEPEVLLDGTHTLERCEEVLVETLKTLFDTLPKYKVDLKGLILKSSMALPGKDSGQKVSAKEIAEATVRALKASVPKEVAGVVFLSGGQTSIQATENLNEMAKIADKPWPLTFSYSRALQEPVMKAWLGKDENVKAAQDIFRKRVLATAAASEGRYDSTME